MSEQVLEVVIRVPDAATAEWVMRQLSALLLEKLDTVGIIESEAYDAEQPGDAELLARVLEH